MLLTNNIVFYILFLGFSCFVCLSELSASVSIVVVVVTVSTVNVVAVVIRRRDEEDRYLGLGLNCMRARIVDKCIEEYF